MLHNSNMEDTGVVLPVWTFRALLEGQDGRDASSSTSASPCLQWTNNQYSIHVRRMFTRTSARRRGVACQRRTRDREKLLDCNATASVSSSLDETVMSKRQDLVRVCLQNSMCRDAC
jgi:hypothetical protein